MSMLRHPLLLVTFLLALAACGKKDAPSYGTGHAVADASSLQGEVAADAAPGPSPGSKLAYEHAVHLVVPGEEVQPLASTLDKECRQSSAFPCDILVSQTTAAPQPSATLKLRTSAAGVQALLASLSRLGTVVNRSSQAEDLAGPIADNERSLAMKTAYRDRLQALLGRAGNDIDALIKINKELAQVQAEIEATTGAVAHLNQRVALQILTIDVSSEAEASTWRPIADAFSSFGADLARAVSSIITVLAYVLPWLLAAGAAVMGVRAILAWRRARSRR